MRAFFVFFCCLVSAAFCLFQTITLAEVNSAEFNNIQQVSSDPNIAGTHQASAHNYVPNELIIKFKKNSSDIISDGISRGRQVQDLHLSKSLDGLNKKYKVQSAKSLFKNFKENRQRMDALLRKDKASLTKSESHILQRLNRAPKGTVIPDLDRIYKIELSPDQSALEAVEEYRKDANVEYAELNYIVSIDATPNDPLYAVQWPLNNTGQMYPESGNYNHPPGTLDCDIDAPEAWDIHTGGSGTIVAVIDTGADYNHRDLHDNMWVNTDEIPGNGIDDDGNGYVDDVYGYDFINHDSNPIDDHGHGTHVSGTIAAVTNNGFDVAGVCWNAKIMALKFLGSNGSGATSDAVTAFYYAANNGADVISNSWGGIDNSTTLQTAINYAYSMGAIVAAAAGNDNSPLPHYPGSNNNVISVSAVNSNDTRATFSNYGIWVDIAAPGVDILSLRAAGTSMGTVYNSYTTIASGTSMSCPHVSGVAALIISNEPAASIQYVIAKLLNTTDDVSIANPSYKGLLGTGRVNAFKAVQPGFQGRINLDEDSFSCDDTVGIEIFDMDLAATPDVQVSVITDGGDSELITLTKDVDEPWIFKGAIHTSAGIVTVSDGILEVSDGQVITAVYEDANIGSGNPGTATDIAEVDCTSPVISNIRASHITSSGAAITFTTNEPATSKVWCGSTCGGSYIYFGEESTLAKSHTVYVAVPASQMTYYFVVEANDAVGNKTSNDNSGSCYSFTTVARPQGLNVPSQYPTIQLAIDAAVNGNTVWVADGRYTGTGNKAIDFKGKAITVRSESGPYRCIIDCESSGRGFNLGAGSILDGFTITNGNGGPSGGGAISCGGNPVIKNCIITGNKANGGGGINTGGGSSPTIKDCIITKNIATYDFGGGIASWGGGDPTITGCYIADNQAAYRGGGIILYLGNPIVTNCLIVNNTAGSIGGGGVCSWTNANITLKNCTLSGNSASGFGSGILIGNNSTVRITNSIIWNNGAKEIENDPYSSLQVRIVSYSDIRGGETGTGNINADPLFVTGSDGSYYLSQIDAGQTSNSPCVNMGSDTAGNLGMDVFTTRTDKKKDIGKVDMGYHYLKTAGSPDIDENWYIDFSDFAMLASDWLDCSGNVLSGDINNDACVDMTDLEIIASNWLNCYVTAASNYYPADNAVNVTLKPILSWSACSGALYQDVYFGTDVNDVNEADTLSPVYRGRQNSAGWNSANYDSNGLALLTDYYWRVDEIGPVCVKRGDVKHFITTSVADPNFVSWWKLDETAGTTAYDSAGPNNGIIYGAQWTGGQVGGALDFDGIDDKVVIPDNDKLTPARTMTLSFWAINRNGKDTGVYKMASCPDQPASPGNSRAYQLAIIGSTGKAHFTVHSSVSITDNLDSIGIVSPNQWHLITATFNNGAAKIYIDGQLDNSKTMTVKSIMNDAQPLIIGGWWYYCGTPDGFTASDGVIDDVRLYNISLSETEIHELYLGN